MATFPLLRNILFVVDLDAEMDQCKHGQVHQDALDQQRSLEVVPEPKYDPQCVGHQQGQTDEHGEPLGRLLGLYL